MDYKRLHSKMFRHASEPDLRVSYLCLVDDTESPNASASFQSQALESHEINNDHKEEPILVERTAATHCMDMDTKKQQEIFQAEVISSQKGPKVMTVEEPQYQIADNIQFRHLQLTRLKWLTEDVSATSSSHSISPATSLSSTLTASDTLPPTNTDRLLSTILQLDREQQMFGLSNLPIDWSAGRQVKKLEEKPVFYQTAIVQVCCSRARCRHKSNSDLPYSLKCGGCRSCMLCPEPLCPPTPCAPPVHMPPPCVPSCYKCPKGKCTCKKACRSPKCYADCASCFGMKITLNKKPKIEPPLIELVPRASCVLAKPFAARPCSHCPPCIPPSSCFPYLMPCFWPCREAAPCTDPANCFHKPPCQPPRVRGPCDHRQLPGGCQDNAKKKTCTNKTCPRMLSKQARGQATPQSQLSHSSTIKSN